MNVKKAPRIKGKADKVRDLARKLNVKGNIEIVKRKSWFSDAMDNLEKEKK